MKTGVLFLLKKNLVMKLFCFVEGNEGSGLHSTSMSVATAAVQSARWGVMLR